LEIAVVIIFLIVAVIVFVAKGNPKNDPSVVTIKARLIDKKAPIGAENRYLIYALETGETVRLIVGDWGIYNNTDAEKNKWGMLTYPTPEKDAVATDGTGSMAQATAEVPPSNNADDKDYVEWILDIERYIKCKNLTR